VVRCAPDFFYLRISRRLVSVPVAVPKKIDNSVLYKLRRKVSVRDLSSGVLSTTRKDQVCAKEIVGKRDFHSQYKTQTYNFKVRKPTSVVTG